MTRWPADRNAGVEGLPGNFGLASNEDQVNPKVLPRRLMEDELAERSTSSTRRLPRRVRQGGAAMALARLPSIAIRLSIPRRHPARAREPPPRRHLRELLLLGRRDCLRTVRGDGCARGLQRSRRRQGAPAARPARRSDLPWSAHPADQLYAADVFGRQHLGHAAADQQDLVRTGAAQAPDRHRADVDRRQRRGLRRPGLLFDDRERLRLRADRGRDWPFAAVRAGGVARLPRSRSTSACRRSSRRSTTASA